VCRCSEILYSLRGDETALLNLNDDSFKFNHSDLVPTKDIITYQLARSYFNQREYLRASNLLLNVIGSTTSSSSSSSNCDTGNSTTITAVNPNETNVNSGCYFLYIYAKYMAVMKKCVDNKADLFSK
jgi:hypothetical protein